MSAPRKTPPPDTPAGAADREPELAALVARARALGALEQSLRLAVPPIADLPFGIGGTDEGTLTLVIPSPEWGTLLRAFEQPICAAANHVLSGRDAGPGVVRIKLRVSPQAAVKAPGPYSDPPPRRVIPNSARDGLAALAQGLAADDRLGAVLRRLAAPSGPPADGDGSGQGNHNR